VSTLNHEQFNGWVEAPIKTPEELKAARAGARRQRMSEYHAAREHDVREQEKRTGGYAGDIKHEKETGVKQPITYKGWLKGR
jgi:hypothetical protein